MNGQNKITRLDGSNLGAGFNAQIVGNRVVTRGGRTILAQTQWVSPSYVYTWSHGPSSSWSELTALSDRSPSTTATITNGSLGTTETDLFVRAPYPFTSINVTVTTPNTSVVTGGPFVYCRGILATGVVDGTASGGVPLAASGTISWTPPSPWIRGPIPSAPMPVQAGLYEVFIVWNTHGSAGPLVQATLSQIQINSPDTSLGIVGLTEDSDGTLILGSASGITNGTLLRYDPASLTMNTVAIPASSQVVGASDHWRFIRWDGKVIATPGSGSPCYLDGNFGKPLQAVQGTDNAQRTYLGAIPTTKFLTAYRNRLYGASGNVVAFSEADNATNVIPTNGTAPLGGAHLWPADNNFSVGSAGEVNSLTVFRDRLVIHSGGDVWSYDQSTLYLMEPGTGTVAPESVAVLPFGMVWLASDGVRLFNGASSTPITDAYVRSILDTHLNRGNWQNAVGVYLPRKHQYRLYVPVNGSPHNRLCLVWDFSQGMQQARWYVWGGTPYWLEPNPAYKELEVSSAAVMSAGTDDELLVTGDYDGNLWIEDRGISDGGYPIYFAAMFRDQGDDEGFKTYRDVRIDAQSSGATLKLAMLPDGESFPAGVGSTVNTPGGRAQSIATLLPGQTTWLQNTSPAPRATGVLYGPVRSATGYRIGNNMICRTVAPVIYSDGTDSAGTRVGGLVSIGHVEIEYRPRVGRRGGGGGAPIGGAGSGLDVVPLYG